MTEKIEKPIIESPDKIEKLPDNVNLLVQELKIDVDDILSRDNTNQVRSFFYNLWIKSYYDFYFYWNREFNILLTSNKELRKFFNKIVWIQNIKNSYANTDNILFFADKIWFEKFNVIQLKEQILSDLNSEWIYNLNDLEVYWITKYKNTFNSNSYIKYYFFKKTSKFLSNMDSVEIIDALKILWLDYLDKNEILNEVLTIFNNDWINYLEDLDKVKVREFREKYITPNPKFLKYIQWLWIKIKTITKSDLLTIWESIWFKNKKINRLEKAKIFLKSNWIWNYLDLRDFWINWARDFLWNDESCRDILNWFGLEYLQDFREDHLKRFARYVWLDWICGEKESDENSIKDRMILKLLNNWVDCDYSLKLFWIKAFKNLFKEKNIWKIRYNEVNNIIKNNLWVIIPLLTTQDLEKISDYLWFKKLSDFEHKELLINFFNKEWLDLENLTRNHVKEKYWSNIHMRYFFEKIWLTTVKDLRLEHINELKRIIKRI